MTWRGINLSSDYIPVNCNVFTFSKGKFSYRQDDPNKITRSTGTSVQFIENSALYINNLDLKELTPRNVKKAFEGDSTLKVVQVICPNDVVTIESLNKKMNLDKMNPSLLSSINKTVKAYKAPSERFILWRLRGNTLNTVPFSILKEDPNKKVFFYFKRNKQTYGTETKEIVLNNGKTLNLYNFEHVSRLSKDYSFYGVEHTASKDRVKKDLAGLQYLEDFLKEKVFDDTFDPLEVKYCNSSKSGSDRRITLGFSKIQDLIKDKNSLYLKKLHAHFKVKNLNSKYSDVIQLYEWMYGNISSVDLEKWLAKNPDMNLEELDSLCDKKYPVLKHLYLGDYEDAVLDIAEYINLVDSKGNP